MQTNKNDPAFPFCNELTNEIVYCGMTKLEYFSIQCLKGILSNPELNRDDSYNPRDNAILAIEAGKLLIYELNKEDSNASNSLFKNQT